MPRKGENIYKRKDGRWEARYVKGCTTEGKTAYGYCYGKTYREAKAKVTEAKARLVQNLPHTGGGTRRCFSSYCDEWLKINRSKVKESTYVKYLSMLDKHIKPKLGNYYVQSLSSVLIEQFSYELLSENGLSPKTVRDILTLLRSILKYVSRQLPSMPHIDIVYPKDSRKEMRVLNKDEQAIFTSYLLTDMDARKFGTLLALMTGMRIGEICALRWSDVDLSENVIHVHYTMQRIKDTREEGQTRTKVIITEPKSETSIRDIPLTEYAAGLCRRWKAKNPAAFLLTGTEDQFMEPRCLQNRLKEYTKNCNLEGVHFHTLRHTFATRCVEVDFEIKSLSEILGQHRRTRKRKGPVGRFHPAGHIYAIPSALQPH